MQGLHGVNISCHTDIDLKAQLSLDVVQNTGDLQLTSVAENISAKFTVSGF